MLLIKRLAKTPNANDRLKSHYFGSNFALTIDFYDWLKLDFRYQAGIFLDYLAKENIGIIVTHSSYTLYILDNNDADINELSQDWMFTITADNTYIIDACEVKHPAHVNTPDIMLQESLKEAIYKSFQLIHSVGKGYSDKFNSKLHNDDKD